jgi:trans-aconitate 2-methyltransferase
VANETELIREFYDHRAPRQEAAAFNERHQFLYQVLLGLGLNKRSRVLELGCGIGATTSLIARTATHGRILAVDLSPASVERAQARLSARHCVEVTVGDVVTFRTPDRFDLVTLFDVLEHVPMDRHGTLFESLAGHVSDDTVLVINIPNPAYIQYLRTHEPASLQVVDLPVWADHVMTLAYAEGLTLESFRTYSLWVRDDYQVMVFRRKKPFVAAPTSPPPAWRRLAAKVRNSFDRIRGSA